MTYSNVRLHVVDEEAPQWLVGQLGELECTNVLLKGVEGDFVVRKASDGGHHILMVHVQAIPDRLQHIGVRTSDGKLHSGLVKRVDNENDRILVQWITEGELVSKPLKAKDVYSTNPRARIRIEQLPIDFQNGLFTLRGTRAQFTSLEDLITHFTHIAPLNFDIAGESHCIYLNAAVKAWSEIGESTMSPPLRADLRIPTPLTSTECEELLSSDNAETGDFVVRLADSRERMGCSYVISVLGAIRVTHIGIVLKDNNKLASAKQPSIQFSTLSELIDHAINTRLDGALLRRTFVPTTDKLSSADGEVAPRVAALSLDEPAPWESASSTPTASALPSPYMPPTRAPVFSWTNVLKSSTMQSEIDNIYGDHELF
eukprot:m.222996 g.222996  ORF g.222996 m.222996 type:complete len:372 (+) comp16147_c0_seq1:193-1308(+)